MKLQSETVSGEALIGVDMGATNVRAARISRGRLQQFFTASVPSQGSEKEILDCVLSAVESVMNDQVGGVGCGVPGVVDEKGVVYDVINAPAWKEVALADALQKRFGRPALVNNDANCFALGEKHFGKGRDCSSFVALSVGTGLGAGLIVHDRLYSGAHCGAGEFGMIPYRDQVLEYFASGQLFENVYGIAGTEVFEKALQDDSRALRLYEELGEHLAEAIKIVLLAFDPEMIVLGGSVSKAYRFFEDSLWNRVRDFPYQRAVDQLRIEVSEDEHIAVKGAAALFFDG
ncbi:MAG TPA: ROK family protein [Acidobacteriota bacterium]|nr:ROK family protein [Acidobacteriota bacterium]